MGVTEGGLEVSKFPFAVCSKCGKHIKRHDAARIGMV